MPSWTPDIEQLLREMAAKSQLWSLLHSDSQRYYARLQRWLGIPQVILNGIATSSIVVTLATSEYALLIAAAVLQLIVTLLSALSTFLGAATLASEHAKAESSASTLSEDISVQLALAEPERMDAKRFIELVRATLATIRNQPPIRESILQKYGKLFDMSASSPAPPAPAPFAAEVFGADELEQKVNPQRVSALHEFHLKRLNELLALRGSGGSSGNGASTLALQEPGIRLHRLPGL